MISEEKRIKTRNYSLLGNESDIAIESGLAEATWYTPPISRSELRKLLVRKDGPAVKDTLLWFFLLGSTAGLFVYFWPSWWSLVPYLLYCALYAGSSDSRWHESSHGTAFKTARLNNILYEIASFMVFRQSVPWRWSHTRHHSDTIIRGRDPEIASPRPPDLWGIFLQLFALKSWPKEMKKIIRHSAGKIDPETATYLPQNAYPAVFLRARVYLAIYLAVISLSVCLWSFVPIMLIILPTFLGSWLTSLYGYTQHAGLAENVLDHRLNCRTVYMNRINRFLYWNMNYHLEHHMFPLVPYHALPRLHEILKEDCPKPYNGILEAYQEIIPCWFRQLKNPEYHVKREIPIRKNNGKREGIFHASTASINAEGWVPVCDMTSIEFAEVVRFDCNSKTYAIYRNAAGEFYGTDGICTHGNSHLADGLLIDDQIECPKHNGRFNIKDGKPERLPVCIALQSYKVKVLDDKVWINVRSSSSKERRVKCKVVKNDQVATFIKELVLNPSSGEQIDYRPGEYIQLEIPASSWKLGADNISENFKGEYRKSGILDRELTNNLLCNRNYSFASNPAEDDHYKFNVRIAMPPEGQDCPPGIGSSYVFQLKEGDEVYIKGPYGDFHIKDSDREMVYIGGGAGMAPLRSHLSYLLETMRTSRKISFWYGARSEKDLFYKDYFQQLASECDNFSFHVALSENAEGWDGFSGYIHEVLNKQYFEDCNGPEKNEYYLCGPPAMIKAVYQLLQNKGVPDELIAFDEF